MNTQMFLENFGPITNALGGVKRLREMILQLAVTGTLTERDQNDTEADVLFRLNQQHRDRLIEKKELQTQKPLPQIDDASVPWILPDTWKWCRLGQVTSYGSTDKAEYSDVNSETWVLELEDIEKETSRLLSKVRAKDRKFLSSKNQFVRGQVLYGKLRPYLDKVVVADEGGVCTTEIIPILPFEGILSEYLRWYLKCPFFKSYANNSTHGMNLPRLGTEPARLALFAFPPIEEQKRIVAKVDELMALCDKLEAQQQERERRFPVLSRACHARFVESPSLANLKAIFDEAEIVSTEDLRKTILTLAVQGKFSTDSLVINSVGLLESIRIEKENITKSRKKTGRTTYQPEEKSDHESGLPLGWINVCVSEIIVELQTGPFGSSLHKRDYEPGGIPVINPASLVNGRIVPIPDMAIGPSTFERLNVFKLKKGDLILARRGEMGRCAVVTELEDGWLCGTGSLVLRLPSSVYSPFLALVISAPESRSYLSNESVGATMQNLNQSILLRMPMTLPPLEEQHRIVAKVNQLMALIDKLEEQQARKAKVAETFAQAVVSAITGTEIKEPEKMKAPKTELVSRLQTKNTPNATDPAPLTKLLTEHNGELPAKALWQRSGLEIGAFYQQLRTEMANGWIIEPEKAVMKEIEAD